MYTYIVSRYNIVLFTLHNIEFQFYGEGELAFVGSYLPKKIKFSFSSWYLTES